jgi:hypothetical protein
MFASSSLSDGRVVLEGKVIEEDPWFDFEAGDVDHFFRYRKSHYILDKKAQRFLEIVKKTCLPRKRTLEKGMTLWRAQLGFRLTKAWVDIPGFGREHGMKRSPHGPKRMKPPKDRSVEGRVNPKGIPCLYLATDEQTALSEVRPWVGSYVSLARFRITKKVSVIDCTVEEEYWNETDFDLGYEKAIWADINGAFSEPVSPSDSTAEYVPTQTLAELFKSEGYDGLMFRSSLTKDGVNVALFNLQHASFESSSLHKAVSLQYIFEDAGFPPPPSPPSPQIPSPPA